MKRRSLPQSKRIKQNSYGRKVAQGNQMYGPGCGATINAFKVRR